MNMLLLLLRNRRFHYAIFFGIVTFSVATLEDAFTLPRIFGLVPLHYIPEIIGIFLLGTTWFAIGGSIKSALILYVWMVFITPLTIAFSSPFPLLPVILIATPIVAMMSFSFIIGYYVAKKEKVAVSQH